MRKLILFIVLIPFLTQAQDITGKWKYVTIEPTIDPVVLYVISGWVLKQTK